MEAPVYVNWDRWVVNCPRTLCTDAAEVQPGQPRVSCVSCGQQADLVWPADPGQITAALAERPVPSTRNWFPAGHPMAVAGALPHGQTPDELRAETASQLDPPPLDGDLDKVLAERGYWLDGNTLRRL